MKVHHGSFQFKTSGKKTYEVTDEVVSIIDESGVKDGTVTVFVRHTSASIILMENADPTARKDLEAFYEHLVPEDVPYFIHTYEGPDDMPAHIKSSLTDSSLSIPINNGRLATGTWQGIYLCEHRNRGGSRKLVVTIQGQTEQ